MIIVMHSVPTEISGDGSLMAEPGLSDHALTAR